MYYIFKLRFFTSNKKLLKNVCQLNFKCVCPYQLCEIICVGLHCVNYEFKTIYFNIYRNIPKRGYFLVIIIRLQINSLLFGGIK